MKKIVYTVFAVSMMGASAAQADMIAGSDFSDAAVFNQAGGAYDIVNTDDLNGADTVTVTNWAFAGGGGFRSFDGNAQVGMPNDNVTKIDGDSAGQPAVGTLPADLNEVSFSINIPAATTVDLTDVTWDWRQATGTTSNVRWLAFRTSLDSNLTFSEVGLHRNSVDNETISLAGTAYQNLTNQTVTFHWYAGGSGSGDIDIDTIIVSGEVGVVPEPCTLCLAALGLLGLIVFGRRRKR